VGPEEVIESIVILRFEVVTEAGHRRIDVSVSRCYDESISSVFQLKGHDVSVGISIGITVYPHDDHSIDELLKHADSAMYRAKQQGGSGFAFHEASGYNHAATFSTS